jgi:hypothetical protein
MERKSLKIGQKFGRLTVISKAPRNEKNRMLLYLCQCKCGTRRNIYKQNLVRNLTKSCGCLQKELLGKRARKEKFAASFNTIYLQYKHMAKRRKINFKLTKVDVHEITKKNCYYCNEPANHILHSHTLKCHGAYPHNGIDRIDSSKDYVKSNCVACCTYCNYAKNDLSTIDFLNHIKKIYTYNFNEKN